MKTPSSYLMTFIVTIATAIATTGYASNFSPWLYNVFTIDNIGTSQSPYAVDIEGTVGAGQNVYMTSYSVNVNNTGTPYSIYAGGTVNLSNGQVNNGGIEAAGNISVTGSSVNGNINSGGSLYGSGGTITGNVILGGTNNSTLTVNPANVHQNVNPYSPTQNLSTDKTFFQNAATQFNQAPTVTTYTYGGGQMIVNPTNGNPTQAAALGSGFTYVQLSLTQLQNLNNITINGGSNSYVVFDITDTTSTAQLLKAVNFFLSGSMTIDNILFDLPNATLLTMNGGDYSSVLAPNADITYTNGALIGNLVAQDLYGNGQVDSGYFLGFANAPPVGTPEPSTYLMLGSFLVVMMLAYSRQSKAARA
jgi:choice-of-anchor A domain-containing protein